MLVLSSDFDVYGFKPSGLPPQFIRSSSGFKSGLGFWLQARV